MNRNRPKLGLSQLFTKLRQLAKNNWHYILVLGFSIIAAIGLLSNIDSVSTRSDGYFHSLRLQSVVSAMKDGQLVPQVSPDGADGFGYAYNIFYGPLTSYIAAALRIICFSWPVAINLTYVLLLVTSGLIMCYAMYKISGDKVIAAFAGVFYLFAPYHLLDLFQRMAIGEFAALAFAPLLFLGLYQLVNKKPQAARHLVVSVTAILLSHNLSLVIFAVASVVVVLFYMRAVLDKTVLRSGILALVIICGLSAFYLIPLAEAKNVGNYGIFDQKYSTEYFEANSRSLNAKRLAVPELLWGHYDINDSVASNASIGVIALFTLLSFPFVYRKISNKDERKFIAVLYVLSIVMLLLTTTLVNWDFMPGFLLKMQFPWRFLSVFCVSMCFVEGYTVYILFSDTSVRKQCLFVVVAGLVAASNVSSLFDGSTPGNRLPIGKMPVEDIAKGSAGWQAEYLPISLLCSNGKCGRKVASQLLSERGDQITVLDGKADITHITRNGLKVDFTVDTHDGAIVELPLVFYPGYKATIGGSGLDVGESSLGLVAISIPPGARGAVSIYYGLSIGTTVGITVSVMTIIVSGGYVFMKKRRPSSH